MDPMDRPISKTDIRKRNTRRIIIAAVCILLVLIAARVVAGLVRPSVSRGRIRTAIVDRGPIEATISARGTVVPEYEHIITSPIDSRVTRILMSPGTNVRASEPILELDVSAVKLDLEKLNDQIALKQNERDRAHVDLERTLGDLCARRAIQELELESCLHMAACHRQLVELGIGSENQARKSETDARRARIELEQLDESIANARRTLEVQLEGLDLEIGILEKERDDAARRLELASPSSDHDGVLTWMVPSEGTAVRRGDEIARIADLNSFRVEATIADVHAARLAWGLPVTVSSGETQLRGTISNILPTVENGVVTFEVTLDDPGHAMLRHNLRVDVYVVTDRQEDAVRVKRGAYVTADGRNAVFVVRGDVAVRRPIRLGITNYESYEVLAGLEPGDEVITSDMRRHMHSKEVRLR